MKRIVPAGPRVFLRKPAARDRDEYLRLRRRSVAFLRAWEPAPPRGRTEIERFAEWIRTARGGRHEKLLICRLEDGTVLGAVNVNEIVRGPAQSAFLGYWIGSPYARQGYMTEGSSARYLKIAGRWADHERWALTVEDWRRLSS